jgi:hypothetical protein
MQITTDNANYIELKKSTLSCDLHLGDSRLQLWRLLMFIRICCDLHLGDSRLQFG